MDSERFDGLVRVFGRSTSRRGALGVLAAVSGLGLNEVMAKAKAKDKDKCKRHSDCSHLESIPCYDRVCVSRACTQVPSGDGSCWL